jgi:ABC-type nitrate/sulfonate/bicarbonate transport system permease component
MDGVSRREIVTIQAAVGNAEKQRFIFLRSGRYLGVVSVMICLVAWFSVTEQGLGLVRPIEFPSPRMVFLAAMSIRDVLLGDVVATVARVLCGFFAGVILGAGLGLMLSYSKKLAYFFDPIIESIRPVPVIAMIPFFLMWFGISELGKFLLIALGVFAIIVVSTMEAVRNVPKIYLLAAETLGATKFQIYRTVVLPGIMPELVGSLRVASALSFTLVVAAEFMGANAGIGYRILEARRMFETDVIFLGVVLIGILSAAADRLIRLATNYVTRWSERNNIAETTK